MSLDIIVEAKRLYDLGFGVHWIKPGSKAPVKAKWADGTRDSWETVKSDFVEGNGLGVRLGQASALDGGGYLANIDVDIKSADGRHRTEALALLENRFPGIKKSAPWVKTGYGYRFFIRTSEPCKSGKLGASSEETKVFMPTAEINRRQHAAVAEGRTSARELADGWRVRSAWELEMMSTGKQVVLPPSIHPDTGDRYVWGRSLESTADIPYVEIEGSFVKRAPGRPPGSYVQRFEPVVVDLVGSPLSDRIVDMIIRGDGVEDRSAACFAVCIAMLKARYSHNEIISVLTDKELFLGETGYDHRNTDSRAAAAGWIRDYCLAKAIAETEASSVFAESAVVTEELSDEMAGVQLAEVMDGDWRDELERSGKDGGGPPKPTLRNTLLVLRNAVGEDVFKRDMFAERDAYGRKAPWVGGKKGKALSDDDAVHIKVWLGQRWGFEPNVNVVFEAMTEIAKHNAYHPVRDELEALDAWDGVERIDGWLRKYFGAKGPRDYLAQVFRKWLAASVTRVYEPGAKFDWMPILEGKQGTGKSSFGAILFGHNYFADWLPNLNDKDAALGLMGKRCVEFGELDNLRRSEVDTIKAFVTRQVDKVRPPYGRKSVEIHRQVVFFGTTNKEQYFRDDTGNRRFNPVEVGALNFDALARDRDQLWAEALFIYRNGLEPSLYLEGDAGAHAVEAQQSKMVLDDSDIMAEKILKYIESATTQNINWDHFSVSELFDWPLVDMKAESRNFQLAVKALKAISKLDSGMIFTHHRTKGRSWWKRSMIS